MRRSLFANRRSLPRVIGSLMMPILLAAALLALSPGASAQVVTGAVLVGADPQGVGVNTATNKVYVANKADGTVSVIDGVTDTVEGTITVGASPSGVDVNTATNKIYVSNSDDGTVTVIDGATGTATDTVTVGADPQGVGVNPVTNKIYVANKADGTVSVIDGATDTKTGEDITVGPSPGDIGVNPVTNMIHAVNSGGGTVSVIDGATDTKLKDVKVGSNPCGVGVNPAANKAYVSNLVDGTVSVIDGSTGTVVKEIKVGLAPRGVRVNPSTYRVYVTNYYDHDLSVIDGVTDTKTGEDVQVGALPGGVGVNPSTDKVYVANYYGDPGNPGDPGDPGTVSVIYEYDIVSVAAGSMSYGVDVNPVTGKAYVANHAGGTVSVIDGATDEKTGDDITVGASPRGVGVNTAANRIYVANSGDGTVSVIDGATETKTVDIAVGANPVAVGVNELTNKVYVTNSGDGTVTVIDGATDTAAGTVTVGADPRGIGVNELTNRVYVSNSTDGTVTVIDGATDTATGTVTVGADPRGVGVNPVTNRIYVSNFGDGTVSVIDGGTDTKTGDDITVGSGPDGVGVNPDTDRIYVANGASGDLYVINGPANTVTGTVRVNGAPQGVSVNPAANKVYATDTGSDAVFVVYGLPVYGVPTVTTLSPASGAKEGAEFTLTVEGSNFRPGSVVRWDGQDRPTACRSATELAATIPASDMESLGSFQITVFNPTPGGGVSDALTFEVNNPDPAITGISPTETIVGSGEFALTVNGTGFLADSVVRWDGADRATIRVSATELTATIPASDIASTGVFDVTVFNPAPGGGVSDAIAFNVNNPVPAAASVFPTEKLAGSGAFTLTVNGSDFVDGCEVRWNGEDRTTTRVSETELTANIPASDIASAGTFDVTVFNPAPGGGVSGAVTVTVNNPAPSAASMSPTERIAGSGDFTLTVNGTGFAGDSVVRWNGEDRTTTRVSETELTANIPASDIASAGTFDVTVFNPAPGGGISDAVAFNVNNPAPSAASASPTERIAGSGDFTLTVNGTGFVGDSVVRWNGEDRTTTRVSETELTANIPASDIASAGTASVTVFNPAPGGGASGAVTVTVKNLAPVTTSMSPTERIAGSGDFTLTVKGIRFMDGCKVRWNGADRPTTRVSETELTADIPASDIASAGTASVTVRNPAPTTGDSNARTFTVSPAAASTWYLPEGTTDWGFDTYISITNPNTTTVAATVTYMPTGAASVVRKIYLPAQSQTTLNPRDALGDKDFSTKVESTDSTKPIAVDRTMTWTGPGAPSPEAHSSVGVTSPDTTWYLPEGSSDWGFETWLLVQNPDTRPAECTLTYMIEGKDPVVKRKTVPASSRASFNMADDIGRADASIKVTSNVPVIPERAMYRNDRREGHDSIGVTAPANSYYLAEGTSDWGFTTYVLIQNPNDQATDVTVTYMTESGPKPQAPFRMAANSRKTIRVNDVLPGTDFSTQVTGTRPVIAERAMYWDNGTGEACHDSIGMSSAHMTFYLPDGQASEGRETWTLVQNPNNSEVQVRVTYLLAGGGAPVSFTEKIGANCRKSFNMADSGVTGRASVVVSSLTSGKPIMVERAMYWNNRGAGTDTIGGFSD